jgi:SAM-dependent methyltransferase
MSRDVNWISSIDPRNDSELDRLEAQMENFYRTNPSYYGDIDFATSGWSQDPINRDIVERAKSRSRILEIGCGAARILDHHPDLAPRYTGVDFSRTQLDDNRTRHPQATFVPLTSPRVLPVPDAAYDCVFSMYVCEHAVRPRDFLDESLRVLASRGTWLLRCPDFLGRGQMSSQRCGLSAGTGREKLMRGRLWDAAVTAWDTRVRIPYACWQRRTAIARNPHTAGFYVNTQPTCFEDSFGVDRDAIYLTYRAEICRHVSSKAEFQDAPYSDTTKDMYLVAVKL